MYRFLVPTFKIKFKQNMKWTQIKYRPNCAKHAWMYISRIEILAEPCLAVSNRHFKMVLLTQHTKYGVIIVIGATSFFNRYSHFMVSGNRRSDFWHPARPCYRCPLYESTNREVIVRRVISNLERPRKCDYFLRDPGGPSHRREDNNWRLLYITTPPRPARNETLRRAKRVETF